MQRGGDQFQIIGEPDDDPLSLLGRLIERMRRSLSVKHLVRSGFLAISSGSKYIELAGDEVDHRL